MHPRIFVNLNRFKMIPPHTFNLIFFMLCLTQIFSCTQQYWRNDSRPLDTNNEKPLPGPLPDKLSCYLQYAGGLDEYYIKGTLPLPVVHIEKSTDSSYKININLSEQTITDTLLTQFASLKGPYDQIRKYLADGKWAGTLKPILLNEGQGTNVDLIFNWRIETLHGQSPQFNINGILNRGLIKPNAGSFGIGRYFSLPILCSPLSRTIPKPLATVYLNGDRSYAMVVDGLVQGQPSHCSEPPAQYLMVTQMTENVVTFMRRRDKSLNYIPVTSAQGEIIGWLSHVVNDQSGLLKGIVETIHGPKFSDPEARILTGIRGQIPELRNRSSHNSFAKKWTPDLNSENYRAQQTACPLIIQWIIEKGPKIVLPISLAAETCQKKSMPILP